VVRRPRHGCEESSGAGFGLSLRRGRPCAGGGSAAHQIRGMRGEVEIGKPRWLPKRSAVNVQGLASFDRHGLAHKMGELAGSQMAAVKTALRELLDL